MGEIIVSLDGYFGSPKHNFNSKHAGVCQVTSQCRTSHSIVAKEFGKNDGISVGQLS
jgi:hypothetical protein